MVDVFKIPDWLRRLRESPKNELTRWQRAVRYAVELAVHCAREMSYDRATQVAAALTYHTLFSLLPMIVLAMIAVNAFVGPEDREALKQGIVNWAIDVLQEGEPVVIPVFGPDPGEPPNGPPEDSGLLDDTPPDTHAPTDPSDGDAADDADDDETLLPGDVSPEDLVPGDPVEEIREALEDGEAAEEGEADLDGPPDRREEFERVRERLDDELSRIIDTLEQVDIRSIGVVGVLLFIYGATALLVTVEQSFNAIFGTTQGRPWYLRLPLYYTVITLGPVMLVGAQVLQNQLFAMLEVRDWINWLLGPIGFMAPIVAIWLLLFLLYVLMPNARVAMRPAAVGSLVAAILWTITKDLFGLYVTYGVLGSLYGALALVPLFLLWLWATWLIILFGLELTFTLQAMKGRRFKHVAHKQPEDFVVDPAVLIPLATKLAAAFERGKALSVADLGESANLPVRVVKRMLEILEEAGIVHRVQDTLGQSYSLARPADRIRVEEILGAAELLLPKHVEAGPDEAKHAWRFVGKLHDATHRIAEQHTLASLLAEGEAKGGTEQQS